MQLLTFMLNNVRFGIPVDDVESIETRMLGFKIKCEKS